jgi:hypothetical protein
MRKYLIIIISLLFLALGLISIIRFFIVPEYNLIYCRGGSNADEVKFNRNFLEEIYSSEVAENYPCYIFDPKTSKKTSIKFNDYSKKEGLIKSINSPDGFTVKFLDTSTGYPQETGLIISDVYITKYPLNFYKKYVDTEEMPRNSFFIVGWYKVSRE